MQREVVEFVLSSEGGYSRRDLYGVDRRVVGVEYRYDLIAACRRVLARYGRRRLRWVVTVVFGMATLVGALAGVLWAVAPGVAFVVAQVLISKLPDVVFDAPGKSIYFERHVEDGMTDAEAMRRFAIHSEGEELRAEKLQEERRKAERKAKARRP